MAGPKVLVVDVERDLADLSAERLDEGDQTTVAQSESAAIDPPRAGFDVAIRGWAPDGRLADAQLDRIPTQPVDPRLTTLTAVSPDIEFIGLTVDENVALPVTGPEPHGAIDRPAPHPRSVIQGHEGSPLGMREPIRRSGTIPAGPASNEGYARAVDEIDGPWSEPPNQRPDSAEAEGHVRTAGVSPTDEGARPNAIGNA